MQKIAQQICDLIPDYHNGKVKFDTAHVIRWVSQFDQADHQFILEEFLHLLKQKIYVSQEDARKILIKHLIKLSEHFKFQNPVKFLENVEFLHLQPPKKSQSILLKILDEELIKNYKVKLIDCGKASKKYSIYIDDILCTGRTIFDNLKDWLKEKNEDGVTNLDKLLTDKKIFVASLLCRHTWSVENVRIRLKMEFNKDAIKDKVLFQSYYVIQNHPSTPNQRLNFAYPTEENQPPLVMDYFNNLDAEYKAEFAFRKKGKPENEDFYSSSKNRVRFENILLNKGIELLKKPKFLQRNHRPLGMTNPTKKILGTGTLFFTWNNVSNTTPIVFWWKVNDWYPLFDLDNRG